MSSSELLSSCVSLIKQSMTSTEEKEEKVFNSLDIENVNTIRVATATIVEKAKSGHPGAPMGLAPLAYVLFSKFINGSNKNSKWINRDRFVLSNGHGCALLYLMLHLNGYRVSLNDLLSFRQLNSNTPGHPECNLTDGVEVSTGPLGQGIAQGIGLSIASHYYKSLFPNLISPYIYIICGDGCLQEGVSSEASSLAGHLKLSNLILIWDNNKITIDGKTDLSFTENVIERYKSYGWNTFVIKNGNDNLNEIYSIIKKSKESKNGPCFISISTTIGYGSSKEDTHGVHGSPLGTNVLEAYKLKYGFKKDSNLETILNRNNKSLYNVFNNTYIKRGNDLFKEWSNLLNNSKNENISLLKRLINNKLPDNWKTKFLKEINNYINSNNFKEKNATRSINGDILNIITPIIPEILGGSADLTPSTKTLLKCSKDFQYNSYDGRYFRFGVREFGMFAICNGISAFGGLIPFSATFLNFITYGFGAVRLGALSHLRQIYIMTHDSIFLGEDGPTHQPVEVLPLLRSLPNLYTFRPCDVNEVTSCWLMALEKLNNSPSVFCLTRQGLPSLLKGSDVNKCYNGCYIIYDSNEESKEDSNTVTLIGSGSEVSTCFDAIKQESFKKAFANKRIKIVSALCIELFEQQSLDYKKSVLGGKNNLVISIEASSTNLWSKYSHYHIGVDTYGKSAPLKHVQEYFGFTPKLIAEKIIKIADLIKDKNIPTLNCLLPQL